MQKNKVKDFHADFLVVRNRLNKMERDHKKTHGGFVAEQHSKSSANNLQNVAKGSDDMFNYQSSFLEVGMLLANFYDAISEGDGQRVVCCWKFILLYLVQDGASSRKYALEAFYMLCQINSTLSCMLHIALSGTDYTR